MRRKQRKASDTIGDLLAVRRAFFRPSVTRLSTCSGSSTLGSSACHRSPVCVNLKRLSFFPKKGLRGAENGASVSAVLLWGTEMNSAWNSMHVNGRGNDTPGLREEGAVESGAC